MTAVRCIDLCKTYRQGEQDIRALDHVDFEVQEGGFVCLSRRHPAAARRRC